MSFLPWLPEYELGQPMIDEQHRKWFQLTNTFLKRAYAGQADSPTVQKALEAVVAYARYHFEAEESFMRSFGYPAAKLDAHIGVHNGFVERLNDLAQLQRQGHHQTVQEMITFLTGWLRAHILETDVKYIRFYKRVGSATLAARTTRRLQRKTRQRRLRA